MAMGVHAYTYGHSAPLLVGYFRPPFQGWLFPPAPLWARCRETRRRHLVHSGLPNFLDSAKGHREAHGKVVSTMRRVLRAVGRDSILMAIVDPAHLIMSTLLVAGGENRNDTMSYITL